MSTIPIVDFPDFERWVEVVHSDLYLEWEIDASEYVDLDDWLEKEHWDVIVGWRNRQRKIVA